MNEANFQIWLALTKIADALEIMAMHGGRPTTAQVESIRDALKKFKEAAR